MKKVFGVGKILPTQTSNLTICLSICRMSTWIAKVVKMTIYQCTHSHEYKRTSILQPLQRLPLALLLTLLIFLMELEMHAELLEDIYFITSFLRWYILFNGCFEFHTGRNLTAIKILDKLFQHWICTSSEQYRKQALFQRDLLIIWAFLWKIFSFWKTALSKKISKFCYTLKTDLSWRHFDSPWLQRSSEHSVQQPYNLAFPLT